MKTCLHRYRHLLTLLVTLITGILLPILRGHDIWWWLVVAGLLLGLGDWRFPALTQPLWTLIGKLGDAIASTMNLIVMTLLYLLVIIPIGLALKPRIRKASRLAEQAESFYCPVTEERNDKHMERPF